MNMKIEKGIPMPIRGRVKGELALTLSAMEVGDSVLFPGDCGSLPSLRTCTCNLAARTGKQFSWRQRRVWRIK